MELGLLAWFLRKFFNNFFFWLDDCTGNFPRIWFFLLHFIRFFFIGFSILAKKEKIEKNKK